ncbi:MAG: ferrochelatase [Methanomassiliicoccales archaeon]|jgi:sirohydrochlorin ferrochelatase|nr:ferrochelatase [Methanomassiliicoccales archaeon]
MDVLLLLLALLAGFAFGTVLVSALTCKVKWIFPSAMLCVVLLASAAAFVYVMPPGDRWIAIILVAIAGILGYSIATLFFLGQDRPRELPGLVNRPVSNPGHLAVVYFSHGESEEYDQLAWLHQFREFDEQRLKFMPRLVRPFFFTVLRSKYMKGDSRHCSMHCRMMERLEQDFKKDGRDDIKFYLSFLDAEPRPDVAAAKAYNEGASTIVVANVFLTASNHTKEGDELVDHLKLEGRGVRVLYTEPLWNSDLLRRSFLEKANLVIPPEERAITGVLLVGHGQPDEWDKEFGTETEQENLFRERLRGDFIELGYRPENVRLAWMAFKEPNTTDSVDSLAASGIKKMIFFSAAISADGIHSQSDIPELVEKARASRRVDVIDLGAWNDHPLVIAAIREKIEKALDKAS